MIAITQIFEAASVAFLALFAVFFPFELYRRWRDRALTWKAVKEMAASASPQIPSLALGGVTIAFIVALYSAVAALVPWTIHTSWWSAAACVIFVDLLYYIDHRAGHRVRAYWAIAHSVHHSSHQFDQTTGLRVSFVDGFLSPWFYLPAVVVGFEPLLVGASLGLIIAYQQWLHTETIGRLGWFDRWFNTPSNHRVHHGTQPLYLDRNYGAVLMVWDRLFGTYQAEVEQPRYGLVEPLRSANPVAVHFHEAARLWRDLRRAPWRDILPTLLNPPGYASKEPR